LRILPYNDRWVPNPAEVQAKLTDIHQKMYVFQDNPIFKDKILKNWGNAMVTKCLHELHLFLCRLPRDPEHPEQPLRLDSIKPPKVVRDFTKAKIEKEHPVLDFVHHYMTNTSQPAKFVTVEVAFSQFQQFGRNENSLKIKAMQRANFQEALQKVDIDTVRDDHSGENVFVGWMMSKDVPNLDGHGFPQSSGHNINGFDYVPPSPKRQRLEDDDSVY
jgi:hypothetical protein